jgi:hypothetical protein
MTAVAAGPDGDHLVFATHADADAGIGRVGRIVGVGTGGQLGFDHLFCEDSQADCSGGCLPTDVRRVAVSSMGIIAAASQRPDDGSISVALFDADGTFLRLASLAIDPAVADGLEVTGLAFSASGALALAGSYLPSAGGVRSTFVLELDVNGDDSVRWARSYDPGMPTEPGDLVADATGGYWLAGTLDHPSRGPDGWLLHVDATGAVEVSNGYGSTLTSGDRTERLTEIALTPTGGVVAAGSSNSWGITIGAGGVPNSESDLWTISVGPEGQLAFNTAADEVSSYATASVALPFSTARIQACQSQEMLDLDAFSNATSREVPIEERIPLYYDLGGGEVVRRQQQATQAGDTSHDTP